jgi:signal transduction histidine kinase
VKLRSIGVKLALAYLVPTAALLIVLSLFSYRSASVELDTELGKRLAGVAAGAGTQVRGRYLVELAPGDENARAYLNTRRKLSALMAATGVARFTVFARDGTTLCDTGDSPIGAKLYQLELDRSELERLFATGQPVSSTTFRASDGGFFKAGYALVTASEDDPTVIGGIAAIAPADYFSRLGALRGTLITYGAITLALYAAVSILVAVLLSRPIRRLADSAERIGKGDLEARVPVSGHDELATLGLALDDMREALRQRNQRLQMMLAGIAHEVRNPLGGIELYAGILREELDGDPDRRAHVGKIEREVGHLKAVVNDFLEYARRPAPELKDIDLGELVGEIAELSAADAENAGVQLLVDARPSPARADAAQLRRALLNLVRNALQATARGGSVSISCTADPPTIRIVDTGKGISPDDQAKIFAPFYTTKEKGTGLGLAFVKEIVSDHGGKLSLESTLGRGTTFTLELPKA